MRKLVKSLVCLKIFISMLLLTAACVRSADIKFQWDYPYPMPHGFEMRLSIDNATVVEDCGLPGDLSCVVPDLVPGTYDATCYAYRKGDPDTIIEYSDASNIVRITIPEKPQPPINNRVDGGASPVVIKLSFDEKGNLHAEQWKQQRPAGPGTEPELRAGRQIFDH